MPAHKDVTMLEYGEAYLECSRAAQDELRQVLSAEAYEVAVALSQSFDSTETEIEPVHMEGA
jgi:hypothetical protein